MQNTSYTMWNIVMSKADKCAVTQTSNNARKILHKVNSESVVKPVWLSFRNTLYSSIQIGVLKRGRH